MIDNQMLKAMLFTTNWEEQGLGLNLIREYKQIVDQYSATEFIIRNIEPVHFMLAYKWLLAIKENYPDRTSLNSISDAFAKIPNDSPTKIALAGIYYDLSTAVLASETEGFIDILISGFHGVNFALGIEK